ncbi:MAG TPA: PIN domain-containing protein [Candidatus Dormibacteraeota bacterium]|jgi:predicted nucleic acid-binding protein
MQIAVVDTGPLVAAMDLGDPHHEVARNALEMGGVVHVVPALVVAEVLYFIGRRLGPAVEARFLSGLAELDVRAPQPEDWSRMGDLVLQYRDFPLGGVDASVVALAERLETDLILTLDRRHFGAIRPRHCDAFTLIPSAS